MWHGLLGGSDRSYLHCCFLRIRAPMHCNAPLGSGINALGMEMVHLGSAAGACCGSGAGNVQCWVSATHILATP